MFPKESINVGTIQEKLINNKIDKSFLFDFKNGDFVSKDGKLVKVEDTEALKMWIEKILRTEKFKFKIYSKQDKRLEYGITLQDLIVGYNYQKEFVEAEIKREVAEALLKHPLINNLDNWSIEKNNPVLRIGFRVNLKDGRNIIEEVNY